MMFDKVRWVKTHLHGISEHFPNHHSQQSQKADWSCLLFFFFFPHLPSKPPSTVIILTLAKVQYPMTSLFFFSLTPSSPKAGDSRIDDPVQRGEGREVGLTRDEFTVVFCPIVVACMLSAFYGQGQGCIGASRNTLHLIPRALTWSIRSTRFASSRPVRDT